MEALWNVIGKINTALWSNPMLFLALGSGLIFTICLRFVQVRKLKTMVGLLFNGQASEHGLSSFQAFTLAIAGRVGTGNIVGVATAICAGGPGALFWMWMIAIVGSATTFVECTLSQLHKKKIDGEYKGGWVYYIGDKWKVVGGICSVLFIATLAFTQTLVHSNAMSTALANAFHVPPIACGIVVAIALAAIVFGGVKVIGRVAEIVVPIMSGIYILVALIILVVNYQAIPAAFSLIFKSAFGADQIIGAAMGSAMIWGTKRAIFSSETGMATSTPSAASAEVSHPAKQGLVQSFSVYIDTLFVCTATGLMLIITGCYSVQGADGSYLFTGMGEVGADATWVQAAVSTLMPTFGSKFVAIALFFFAFTTILNQCYSTACSVSYFFVDKGHEPQWVTKACYAVFCLAAVYGSVIAANRAWDLGDTGLGLIVWINYLFLLLSCPVAIKLLRDYERQQKLGLDPVFDPDQFKGVKGFEHVDMSLWREIRDKFKSGQLKN